MENKEIETVQTDTIKETFETLFNLNLKDKTKDKIGLKYLSWAYAWGELRKLYPHAKRIIYRRKVTTHIVKTLPLDGGGTETITTDYETELPYFTDGKTCSVRVGVEINGLEYVEELPVMDNKNHSVRLESVTSTDINRAIQRAFVKACALHGLGLYIYAGEDLPEIDKVVVDYESMKINDSELKTINEDEFNQMKQACIEMLQVAQNDFEEEPYGQIAKYVTEVIPGKRVSLLTFADDAINIQKLHYFLAHMFGVFKK